MRSTHFRSWKQQSSHVSKEKISSEYTHSNVANQRAFWVFEEIHMISRIVEQSEEQQQLHLSILNLVDFGSHGFHQPVELSYVLVV